MMVQDPVCGAEVEAEQAPAMTEHEEQRYWFCSADCQIAFERDPHHYTDQRQR